MVAGAAVVADDDPLLSLPQAAATSSKPATGTARVTLRNLAMALLLSHVGVWVGWVVAGERGGHIAESAQAPTTFRPMKPNTQKVTTPRRMARIRAPYICSLCSRDW